MVSIPINIRRLLLSLLLLFTFQVCLAQDPDDPSPTDPAVPVDGGISLLLAAGAAYGSRRLLVKKSRKSAD
jgi:hypothetical protein